MSLFTLRFLKIIAYLICTLSLVVYVYRILIYKHALFDDSYMFIRYANNLLAGYGYAWNRDHINTFGCTSILYTFLIAFLKLAFPQIYNGKLLLLTSGTLGLLSILALVYTLNRLIKNTWLKQPYFIGILIIPFLTISPPYIFHARNGMDTMLALLLNILLIYTTLRVKQKNNGGQIFLCSLIAYLCFLSRPDNFIYSLLFPILSFVFLLKLDKKSIFTFLFLFFSLIFIDTLAKIYYFGSFLPLPYFAKQSSFLDGYIGSYHWNPVRYVSQFFLCFFPYLISIVLFYQKKANAFLIPFLLPLLLIFLYFFSPIQIMGFNFRFYFPSVPFLIIAGFLTIDGYLTNNENIYPSLKSLLFKFSIGLIILIIILLGNSLFANLYENKFLMSPSKYYNKELSASYFKVKYQFFSTFEIMQNVLKSLPPNTIFAASEHGYISAENPDFHIIDIVGLHDPHIAKYGFTAEYLFSKKPDIIWFPPADYPLIIRKIKADKNFTDNYYYFPKAINLGIAVRKDRKDLMKIIEYELKALGDL